MKENFSTVTRDKDSLAEENRQLKQLLAQHGIPWTGTGGVDEFAQNRSTGYTSSGSISGSYGPGSTGYSPPPNGNPNYSVGSPAYPPGNNGMNSQQLNQRPVQPGMDYDQAGIDFVLTYDNPSRAYLSPPQL